MPEIEKLIEAFENLLGAYEKKATEARTRAERIFAREKMADLYLDEINQLL